MRSMRVWMFLGGVLCLGLVLSPLVVAGQTNLEKQNRGTRVDVDRSGVHIESGAEQSGALSTEPTGAILGRGTVVRVKDLIGLKVLNPNNEDLGKVEDLVIDLPRGKIRYGVLSFGGFLGVGDKLFAIPWDDLKLQAKEMASGEMPKEHHFVLAISKDALKNAPGFAKDKWPNFADPNWSITIEKYYGEHRKAAKPAPVMR
jgi:sporulation protein YlmC with PRC-barrel domain